ncbi:hypothetical protein [uncultured Abyssibacter sp.]|uniref:nucleotidyltransferase domain-containing protein n=1 Tax=uncultured Abyssibacter sp. TaxID=2320202 RepID=UPI0032B23018
MRLNSVEMVLTALENANVRYLVVGGLAVNAHGYARYTKDIDLVIQLDQHNVLRAFHALEPLGYQPLLPVKPEQFADADTRACWVRDRNMQVFQLWSDAHRETPIDVFVTEPFDFDAEYDRASRRRFGETLDIPIVSRDTLIRMKRAAGRVQDLADIDNLRLLEPDA